MKATLLTPEEARTHAFAMLEQAVEDAQRMRDQGMDPNGDDEGWPFIADCLHRPKKLKALLEAGANVNVRLQGWINGHIDAEDLTLPEAILCDHWRSDSDSDRNMFLARLECFRLLLDYGAPSQVRDEIEIPTPFRAALDERLAQQIKRQRGLFSPRDIFQAWEQIGCEKLPLDDILALECGFLRKMFLEECLRELFNDYVHEEAACAHIATAAQILAAGDQLMSLGARDLALVSYVAGCRMNVNDRKLTDKHRELLLGLVERGFRLALEEHINSPKPIVRAVLRELESKDVANSMDKALPPPAPAVPSTRGRL